MRLRVFAAVAAVASLAACAALTGCGTEGGVDEALVTVNAGEPQNPLIPTDTNENMGGRVVDRLWAGLLYYDANGNPHNEVAKSIDTTDRQHYTITLQPNWTFTNGEPVTAHSFVDAWNYGALSSNAQLNNGAFAQIAGYADTSASPPRAQTMSGLKVIDDHTFTVDLTSPSIDFELSLGWAPFYPLPSVAYKDMKAFGENPIGDGPYMFPHPGAWQHNVEIDVIPNPGYHGGRPPRNKGLRFVMYQSLQTAYNDLLSDNLDALDTIPDNALSTFTKDLGDRAIRKATAQSEEVGIQATVPHFGGREGMLRRQAISMAINRQQICDSIFHGSRVPARDFTATTLPGFDPNLPGSDVLRYNPARARQLWDQANAISKWSGRFEIAFNSDGGHQAWIDAVANSIKNTLHIDAAGAPYPTFKQLLDQVDNKTIGKAFRHGWQGDYPSMFEFLTQQFASGFGSNMVFYSNPAFDQALDAAQAAPTPREAYRLAGQAQTILLTDLPTIPLLDHISSAGRSENVSSAPLSWNGLFDYENIVKP